MDVRKPKGKRANHGNTDWISGPSCTEENGQRYAKDELLRDGVQATHGDYNERGAMVWQTQRAGEDKERSACVLEPQR